MAHKKNLNSRPPLKQRGQGAVEAMLALPVFLTLVCIIFQLFFLGIAQVQLRYAAFYAARVGAVKGGDPKEMKQVITTILGRFPGVLPCSPDHLKIEILDSREDRDERDDSLPSVKETLKVRVHWHYPLIVPLADTFHFRNILFPVPGRPTVHLQASWAMTMFGSKSGENIDGKGQKY